MTLEDTIKQAVREVLREEFAKHRPSNATPPRQEYFTPDEAAELLRVSGDTVRGLCSKGKLPAKKVAGQWRIRRSDIDLYDEIRSAGEDVPDPREAALAVIHGGRSK